MHSMNNRIPFWASALSGTAALFCTVVLVWYFCQLAPAEVSAKQVVFVAPVAATIFAAYIAVAGRLPKVPPVKHTDDPHG